MTAQRKNELFDEAMTWISEICSKSDLYNILTKSLGMTDKEITEIGFDLCVIKAYAESE